MQNALLDVDPDDYERVGDTFLRLNFTVASDADLGAELGAEPVANPKQRLIRNALIVALLLAFWRHAEQWVAYSRDRNNYAGLRAYFGDFVTYQNMMWAVETLEVAGLIDHDKTRPSRFSRFRSTLRFRSAAAANSAIQHVRQLVPILQPLAIRLKDAEKALISFEHTRHTTVLQRDVLAQNEALRAVEMTLDPGRWQEDSYGLLRCEGVTLNPVRQLLYRVFNVDWRFGGRWYGGFWQGLPSADRGLIRLNGKSTIELDYDFLHPQLLAAAFNIDLGDGDPYEIPGIVREHGKRGMNILINADTVQSAVLALQREFMHQRVKDPGNAALDVINGIMNYHTAFARAWGTGAGRRLQNVDAEMCASVQRTIRGSGSVALSVHDSFIVDASIQAELQKAMDDALFDARRKLKKNGLDI